MTATSEYDYDLPKDLIAQHPLANRGDARMMVVDRKNDQIIHSHIRNLSEFITPRDCLVVNDSRVVPARLIGYRSSTRGRWEGLFLSADDHGLWRVLGKARGKLVPGETIQLLNEQARDEFRIRLIEKEADGVWVVRPEPLKPEPASDLWQLLERVGRVPLPHYIRAGEMIASDRQRYQTVYAKEPGSVAAPTAGLHFTEEALQALKHQGIHLARVTLHVGIGTFRPISTEEIEDHSMHHEVVRVTETACQTINETRGQGGRVIAIGTTAVRSLESAAAHAGVDSSQAPLAPWSGETNLYIQPGYKFRVVDGMLTNFHLPRSTLLVLVSTIGGKELIKSAYREAMREEYRFFSYGDAMLIV
jgi:S-adenosylmethionine:tRNA ribosyltransferase-isomerase